MAVMMTCIMDGHDVLNNVDQLFNQRQKTMKLHFTRQLLINMLDNPCPWIFRSRKTLSNLSCANQPQHP